MVKFASPSLISRNLHRFCQLNPTERRLILDAIPLLIKFALILRLFGFNYYRNQRKWKAKRHSLPLELDIASAELAINRVSNGLKIGSCLVRSMALQELLQRAGIGTQLKIGVNQTRGKFKAHAWLELDGVPIGDTDSDFYVVSGIS